MILTREGLPYFSAFLIYSVCTIHIPVPRARYAVCVSSHLIEYSGQDRQPAVNETIILNITLIIGMLGKK